MTSNTGPIEVTPAPLHRRYDEAKSLELIRNRYLGMKGEFDTQLEILQKSPEFLKGCQALYDEGYKDWHILSAIYNFLINLEQRKNKVDLSTRNGREASMRMPKMLKQAAYPPEVFDGPEWQMAFTLHALTCLHAYGFEIRSRAVSPQSVIKFLRERMRHFDLDIPHSPMFGNPPAGWPEL